MNQSVIRAVGLLEHLAMLKGPASLKDLAGIAGLDKATAYRLLTSLREKNLVQRVDNNKYGLDQLVFFLRKLSGTISQFENDLGST